MYALSTSSINDEVSTASPIVSTGSTNVNTASTQDSTASLSDATVYAFLANHPNGSHLVNEDLEQIHEDDLEEMDLKWQLALLSMRARRYYQRTGNKITISGSDTAGDNVLESTIDCDKESDNSKENTDDSLEKEQVTDNERESVKPKNDEKPVKKTVRYAEMYRSQCPRGNQRNWNGQKSNQLGSEFVMYNKACYGCGSFDHIQFYCPNHQKKRRMTRNNYNKVDHDYYSKTSHPSSHRNMTPKAVLLKTGLKPLRKPHMNDKGFVDSGCSRHMTGNIAYLTDFKEYNGGYVIFGGGAYGGRITGKGTLKTDYLDFKDVHYVDELKFNLFSVSQMCDKKNYVLFTNTECLVLSPNFKLPDENQILLRIPREDNMYSFDMKNIVPKESLTCLVAKTTSDESMLRHRRLGHINFKNINKLVKENLVRENLVDQKVKIIRCDNGTEFKNKVMDDFCKEKGIKREYSIARTPQQNGVVERRNRTLIEAARTMVLIVKPHNKTPYELFRGIKPALSFMKPFGCHVTILNTLDSKAFRVYNTRTKKVEENLHIRFLENKPMIEGNGPKWPFDIDSLTQSMNYVPVTAGTSSNESTGTQEDQNAGTFLEKDRTSQDCIVMPIWKDTSYFDSPSKQMGNDNPKSIFDDPKENEDGSNNESNGKEKSEDDNSTKQDNTADQRVNTASLGLNTGATHAEFFNDEDEPNVDLGNIPIYYAVPTTPHKRIHINHPLTNVIGDIQSSVQTRRMKEPALDHGFLSVWVLVDLPNGKRAIGTKCILGNKKDERGIVIRNKTRIVAQGHTQEEAVARIKAIRIEEKVYVCQPLRFEDPNYPDKVYRVMQALYGLHQAPRAWYETLAHYLLGNGFYKGKIDQTMFIKKQKGDILLV
ncbi:retrovirus-related pol polyprotein from transposon TNT 1-94, partial [Tanacetum coccineum]